jgi:hypothetical protein
MITIIKSEDYGLRVKKWTVNETKKLIQMVRSGQKISEMAIYFRREEKAVEKKITKLGYSVKAL